MYLSPLQVYLNIIALTFLYLSLSYILYLVLENKGRVSRTPMWDIIRITCWLVYKDLCLEDKDEMIWRMIIIKYIWILPCASWLPPLITSGSDILWNLGFELVFSGDMVLVAPIGSPLGYSINILLGLVIENSFDIWEGSLVVVLLVTLAGLVVVTGEGYLVLLLLVLLLGSPFYSPNPGADMHGTLLVSPLVLWFLYEAFRYLCSYRRLMEIHKTTCWGG